MQDRDLGIYKPSESTTSRHLPCSHELCSPASGCTNPKQPCPYNIDYFSENTTSSGLLIEDMLHLDSREGHAPVNASVIIGYASLSSALFFNINYCWSNNNYQIAYFLLGHSN
jgi:hypothetical protein